MYSESKRQHTDTVQSMRQQLRFLEFSQARNSHYSVSTSVSQKSANDMLDTKPIH